MMVFLIIRYLFIYVSFGALVSAGIFEKRNIFISSFKYRPCDSKSYQKNIAWVKDVDVLTTDYGELDVLASVVTTVNLTSPIKASVSMRRNVLGIYVPLPCIKDFGSCEYPDLCTYGYTEKEDCPPIFEEHDIPCRCPIQAGSYNFPGGHFLLPKTRWAGILAGEYKGNVKFYSKNRLVACYKFFYKLE